MGKMRASLSRGVLAVLSFLGGVILIFPLAPIMVLIGSVRELIFTISIRTGLWKNKYDTIVKGAVFFFYLQIAIGVPWLAIHLLGMDHLFDGIVAAGLIIAFLAFQYPRMLPPSFDVTFTTPPKRDKTYSKSVEAGTDTMIFLYVTNLGLIHLKNCACYIEFEEGFKALGSPSYLCSISSQSRRLEFSPNNFYLSLPPFLNRQMVARVQTPIKPGNYKIKIGLYSESTWGMATQSLSVRVTDSK